MQIINSPQAFQVLRKTLSGKVGFVATMGNLHEGHASLLQRSKQENTTTVLSIFINPTQFNNPEDFKNYPKTLEQDIQLAKNLSIDYLFLPDNTDLYPDNYKYKMSESEVSAILEGKFRPGHFEGMLTIVLKLLLIVSPTRAYFGEKDYQQFILIKRMAEAFFLNTEIIGCPTIRNKNNLPLSSRNNRFTPEQFEKIQAFPKIFHTNLTPTEMTEQLIQSGFEVEYIEEREGRRFAAVKYAGIRLIDNIGGNI
jgi:pantoate--beta-alanine ligase